MSVDRGGLRIIKKKMPRRARTTRRGIRNLGKLTPNAKRPELQNFVVILKIRKVICISFSNREQILNLQVRRTVWSGSRFRLCVLEHCPDELKHAIYISKFSNFGKISEMHQNNI